MILSQIVFFTSMVSAMLASSSDFGEDIYSVHHPSYPNLPPVNYVTRQSAAIAGWGSHAECRKLANDFALANPFWCGKKNFMKIRFSNRPHSVVSYGARKCGEGANCHAEFQCQVFSPYRGCPVDILQGALNGVWQLTCKANLEIVIKLENSKNAFALCYTHDASERRKETIEKRLRAEAENEKEQERLQAYGELVLERYVMQDTEEMIALLLTDVTDDVPGITCLDVSRAGSST